MDRFFAIFGKFALVLILVGTVAYGAYYIGKTTAPTGESGAVSVSTQPSPTIDPGLMPETLPSTTTTPATKPAKTITAGLDASSGLSFTKYRITAPQDWIETHTTTNEGTWVDTLTLTRGTTQLKIFQAATGGAMCLYPEDPEFEGPSSKYDAYVEITTADGTVLRRGWTNANAKAYTMCQKGTESFGQPTMYGHMTLVTGINPDQALLAEVDTIIASLKKL